MGTEIPRIYPSIEVIQFRGVIRRCPVYTMKMQMCWKTISAARPSIDIYSTKGIVYIKYIIILYAGCAIPSWINMQVTDIITIICSISIDIVIKCYVS